MSEPSRMRSCALSIDSDSTVLLSTAREISNASSKGMPLCNKMPRVRVKRDMAILRFKGPKTGSRMVQASKTRVPLSVARYRWTARVMPTKPRATNHQ